VVSLEGHNLEVAAEDGFLPALVIGLPKRFRECNPGMVIAMSSDSKWGQPTRMVGRGHCWRDCCQRSEANQALL
jgi:hypothetical protein